MDNTDDKALNPTVGEEASDSTTPVEEPKAPVEEPKAEPEAEPTGEDEGKVEEPTEEKAPRKGAEARIRELNQKAKSAEEKAATLQSQLEELTSQVGYQGPQAPYIPQVQPGQEIAPEQYQQDVLRSADALVQLRLRQQETLMNINNEANEAMNEYTELNPDRKDAFDKDLSDAVTEATLSYVQANLNRLKKGDVKAYVKKLIRPYKKSLSQKVAEETETIAKQVSQQALRPTNVKTEEKRFEDLSLQEMEKKLGVVY